MRKLDVITTCTAQDLKSFVYVEARIRRFLPVKKLIVFVPARDVELFKKTLGSNAQVRNEDEAIPGITYTALADHSHQVFPRLTGWYYQQFLKFSYAFEDVEDDYYLIWDADTVPLQPVDFFDANDRMLITPAEEYHRPYFETYRNLLGEEAPREFSFISQHLVVQKSVLREMLSRIEARFPNQKGWVRALMAGLPNAFGNLFSEYETYGHYLKLHYPERMVVRQLTWLREGTEQYGFPPTEKVLSKLGKTYVYAAFESKKTKSKRLKQWIFQQIRK